MLIENDPFESEESPDLLLPPHVLPQLFELLAGGSFPDAAQQDALTLHLFACAWCRVTLLYLLSVAEEADQQSGADAAPAHALLERWVDLHHRLEERQPDHGNPAPGTGMEGGAS